MILWFNFTAEMRGEYSSEAAQHRKRRSMQQHMTNAETFDRLMRELTGEAALRPRRPKKVPQIAKLVSRVEVGSEVIVGLRGGGRIEGRVARKLERAVVIESDGGADIIVLTSASSSTRVLART